MAFPLDMIQVFQFPALGVTWAKAPGKRIAKAVSRRGIREFLYTVGFLISVGLIGEDSCKSAHGHPWSLWTYYVDRIEPRNSGTNAMKQDFCSPPLR